MQENIIFHAIKGRQQPRKLVISSSTGESGDVVTENRVSFAEVVHERDAEKFIHIPSAFTHAAAKKALDGLHTNLAESG